MEIEGKVIAVLAPREGTSRAGNAWKAQEYVVETVEQYPKKMVFEIFGADRIAQNEKILQVGNSVKVSFDIDAREWNGRWFNSIRAWKVEPVDGAAMGANDALQAPPADAFPPAPAPMAQNTGSDDTADDLPF